MASKLHRRIRRLIKEILGTTIKEEVNVQKLFTDYPTRDHYYDLVIPSYNLVIECHGEQHFSIQTFGEKDINKAIENFHRGKHRDRRKEEIVWENGWGYLVIAYNELPKKDSEAKKIIVSKIQTAIKNIEED